VEACIAVFTEFRNETTRFTGESSGSKTFSERLPRGKSPSNDYPVLVPSLPAYLDALIFHATHYKQSKQNFALLASWIIRNLTRYLYLELPHQQLPLLMELEEDEYMEEYLRDFKRKPCFVYQRGLGTRVQEWDPTSYPDWCKARAQPQSNESKFGLVAGLCRGHAYDISIPSPTPMLFTTYNIKGT
jgi:hypothetical protein